MADEGGSNNIGNLEISVTVELGDADQKLSQLEERLQRLAQLGSVTIAPNVADVPATGKGRRAQNAQTPPATATAAATGTVSNITINPNLGEGFAAKIREAAEEAFREPIDITIRIANLDQIRDQLGQVQFTGSVPASSVAAASGVPRQALTKEFTEQIHAGGANLKTAFRELIGTIGDFSEELGGLKIEGSDEMEQFADVIRKVLPGLQNYDPARDNPSGTKFSELGPKLSPIYGRNPGLDTGIQALLAAGSSRLVTAGRELGAPTTVPVTPAAAPRPETTPAASTTAATTQPPTTAEIEKLAAAATAKLDAAPKGTPPKGMSRDEFTQFIRGQIGLPAGRGLDLSALSRIPNQGTPELEAFLNVQGAGKGFRSAIPGLGPDVEKLVKAVKFFEVVGEYTSGPMKGQFVAPQEGTADYDAISALHGRGVGYITGGARVRRVSGQELLKQVFSTLAQGDTGELIERLGYGTQEFPSILSRAFRANRSMSVVTNNDLRGGPAGNPNATSKQSSGGLLSPSAYGSRSLESQARMNLQYDRLSTAIYRLQEREATVGLNKYDARRLDRMTAQRDQLVEAGAVSTNLSPRELQRAAKLQRYLWQHGPITLPGGEVLQNENQANQSRVHSGEGLTNDEMAARMRIIGFQSMLPAQMREQMVSGALPNLSQGENSIFNRLIGEMFDRSNYRMVERRGGLLGGAQPETPVQFLGRRINEIRNGVAADSTNGVEAVPGLKQGIAGLPRTVQTDILSAFDQMASDLKAYARGFGIGGAAMKGGGFSREISVTEEDLQRSQSGTGGYTRGRRPKPTRIEQAQQVLRSRILNEYGDLADIMPFDITGYPHDTEADLRNGTARRGQLGKARGIAAAGEGNGDFKGAPSELADPSRVAGFNEAIAQYRKGEQVQRVARGLLNKSGLSEDAGLEEINALRTSISTNRRYPQALKNEMLDLLETRRPGRLDELVPEGRSPVPADSAKMAKIAQGAHNFVPGEENPTPFKDILTDLGMKPAAGGNGNGAPPHLTAMGGNGREPEFAGSGVYRVFVTNWPENIGSSVSGSRSNAPVVPSKEAQVDAATTRWNRNVLNFRRQTTERAQGLLAKEVERLRGMGWSDAQIGRHAREQGLSGVEGLLEETGGGGAPATRARTAAERASRRANAALGIPANEGLLTGFNEEQGIVSDAYLQNQARLATARGRLQQRSIPTTLVTLAENIFGGRQGPVARLAEAQRLDQAFLQVDKQYTAVKNVLSLNEKQQNDLQSRITAGGGTTREVNAYKKSLAELRAAHANLTVEETHLKEQHESLGRAAKEAAENAVGTSDVLRNLGAGAVGGVAGVLAGQGIAQVAGVALQGVGSALGPMIEHAIGDPNTTARISGQLAQAFAQGGGSLGAIAGAAGQTNISAAGYAQIGGPLQSRASTVAGDQALREQIDLIRASANIAHNNQGLSGYDQALFQTTGGLFGTPINGVPSTAEIWANELSRLGVPGQAANANTPTSGRFGAMLSGSDGQGVYAAKEAASALGVFRSNLDKAGGGLKLVQDKSAKTAVAVEELAQNAERFGRSDWANLIRTQGFSVTGAKSSNPFAELMQQENLGAQTIDPALMLQGMARQILATVQTENAATRHALDTSIPAQFGVSQALNPLGNVAAPVEALTGQKQGDLSKLVTDVQSAAKAGRDLAEGFVRGQLPEFSSRFSQALGQAANYAQEISRTQIGVQVEQAAYQASQFQLQLFLANRALKDAKGLSGEITTQNGDNLGIIERSNFMLGQQAAILGQSLQQRQINFQTAIAGFTAPGLTPEERAARIEQAKIEAKYAQEQLNIQKQLTANQRAAFGITSTRGVTDLTKQVALLQQGFAVNVDTAKAEAKIKALSALMEKPSQEVQRILGAAEQRYSDILSVDQQLIAATGKSLDEISTKVLDTFATTFKGETDSINAWIATLGGSPTASPAIPGHGGATRNQTVMPDYRSGKTTIHVNVTGNTIGDKATADHLATKIVTELGRVASIQGLRVS